MLTACGGEELNKFSGITFSDKTVNYNGQEHKIVISGNIPQGAMVKYNNNTATNAGEYAATASISMEGYETLNLKATLKINKIDYDMSNAKWDYSNPFLYDGQEKQVLVTGLPQGVSVKAYHNNKKTNIGTYIASVDFNYDTVNYNVPKFSDLTWNIVDNESGSTEQPGKLKNFEGLSFNGEIF